MLCFKGKKEAFQGEFGTFKPRDTQILAMKNLLTILPKHLDVRPLLKQESEQIVQKLE